MLLLLAQTAHADDYTARVRDGHIRDNATYEGLAFADAACNGAFKDRGVVAPKDRASFARCLHDAIDRSRGGSAAYGPTKIVVREKTKSSRDVELEFECAPSGKDTCGIDRATLVAVRGVDSEK
jgi:hypothetical protein